jgi:16S rRNA C967 or C1407 C5-methylase (RsmB/RsmF family)
MSLRVNLQHQSVEAYLRALEETGIGAKAVGETGVQLVKAVPVHQLPGFDQGHVSVQDAAAQLTQRISHIDPTFQAHTRAHPAAGSARIANPIAA